MVYEPPEIFIGWGVDVPVKKENDLKERKSDDRSSSGQAEHEQPHEFRGNSEFEITLYAGMTGKIMLTSHVAITNIRIKIIIQQHANSTTITGIF